MKDRPCREAASFIVDSVNVYGREAGPRFANEEKLIVIIDVAIRAAFDQGLKAGAETAAVAGLAERFNKDALQRMKREP